MREEGQEGGREPIAAKAFAFDGWTMTPLDASPPEPPAIEDIELANSDPAIA